MTPSQPPSPLTDETTGAHSVRRGGARHEASARVHLVGANLKTRDGWALNVSRGGIRVIVEESVEVGECYDATVGETAEGSASPRATRVMWAQQEPDGLIVGLEFAFDDAGDPVTASLPAPALGG